VSAGGGNIAISTVGTTYETSLRLGTLAAAGNAVSVTGAVGFELGNAPSITPTTTVNASVLDLSAATLNGTLASGFRSVSRETWVAIDTQATSLPFANAANGSIVTVDSARFDVEYGGNVTLTTSTPTTVWVYDEWAGSANGSNVSYDAVNGTFGFNAFNTISAGVAAVADAGFVYVIAGTSGSYNEALTITKDVTIEGIYPDDPGLTVEGAATGAALLEGSGITSPAFTVTGAGVDATIRNLSFVEWINGGVLATNGATVTVEHVTVAGEIGGTFANFGVRVSGASSTLTVDKSLITKGTAIGAYAGVRIDDGTLYVTNSRIEYSNAPGAVAIDVNGGTASVSNNFINNNFFGVDVSNNANATISANDLTLNTRGLRNSAVSSVIVDASTNWWGSTDEAAVLAATTSTGSAGDRVDITPYVREATDTSPLAGFQPNLGNLAVTTLGPQTGSVSRLQDGIDAIQDSGNTTGIDRVLFVNPGDYSGATDVNKSLTLETETLNLNGSLTVSSDARIAEATPGNGATVTVTGAGNNLAVNANLTFAGTGNLALESASGSLTGAGEITSATPLSLSAPNGSITSATNVSDLVATASGNITITEQDGITLSNVTSTSGNVTVTAGGPLDYTLVSAAQDLSLTGTTLDLTSGTLSPGNDLSLEATAGNVDLPAGLTAAANLSVTANGTISDLGALTVSGSTTLSATGDILLDGANDFVGCVDVLAGQNVTVNDTGDLDFCGANVSGSLTATAVGNVTDSGPMTVGGVAELSAGGDVILDAANDFVTVNVTATNAVLNDTNGITIGDSTLTGDLDVTGGNVSSSGNVTVTGEATLNATIGDVTVAGPGIFTADTVNATALGNGADIVLTSFDANTLNAEANCSVTVTDVDELTLQNITAGCNVTATAGGELTIPANGSVSAGCDASLTGTSLNLAGGLTVGGSLELNSTASDLVIGNLSVNGDLIGTASGNVTVFGPAVSGDDVILTGSTVTLTGTTTAGNDVVLNATAGNVSGGGLVTATNVTATALAAGATISVTTAADTVAAAADCDVTIVNEGNLSLSNVSSVNCSVSATANNGSLEVVTGGTVAAGEDVSLTGENLTLTGSVTAGENVTLSATVGDINGTGLVTGDNVTATAEGNDASITLNLAAVTLTAVANCSVTITEADDLAVANITSLSTAAASSAPSSQPLSFTTYTTANGLGGNFTQAIYATGGVLYAGTGGGVSKSTDGGTTWTNSTTASGLGSNTVNAVFADATFVYAATRGGLSISSDGGSNWTNFTTTDGLANNIVNDVYVIGGTIYAATNAGLSVSADGGANWSTAQFSGQQVKSVTGSGSTLLASVGSTNGLAYSLDGGQGWAYRTTADGLAGNNTDALSIDGGTWGVGTSLGFSVSTDNGASWTSYFTPDLADNYVYGVTIIGSSYFVGTDDSGASVTTDGGTTWNTYTTDDGLGSNYTYGSLVDSAAGLFYVANDGGVSVAALPTAGCSVTVTTGGSLDVAGSITASGDVTLDSTAGNITGAGLVTGDQLTATAANGSITANTSVASFTGKCQRLDHRDGSRRDHA